MAISTPSFPSMRRSSREDNPRWKQKSARQRSTWWPTPTTPRTPAFAGKRRRWPPWRILRSRSSCRNRGTVPRTTQSNGVNVVELNVCRYRGKSISAYLAVVPEISSLRHSAHCSRLTLRDRIDVVHIHNMPDFLIFAAIVPRLLGRKVILDIHDSVPETFIGKFKSHSGLMFRLLCLEESICCRLAHRIICVNHPQRDVLVSRGISGTEDIGLHERPRRTVVRQRLERRPRKDCLRFLQPGLSRHPGQEAGRRPDDPCHFKPQRQHSRI